MKLVKHFDAFLKNKVNLSDGRIDQLDSRVESVTNFLQTGEDELASSYLDVIPQGSYAHRTIINPVASSDEFDADVLLELGEIDGWDAEDYVQALYTKFRGSSKYRDMVSRHDRCVKVDYSNEFHIDVVPYMERHGEHFITDRVEKKFELTNPEGFNDWLNERNKLASGRLVKVIRLVKYLRDYKSTFSVKSVILTILLGERVNDAAVWGATDDYTDVPTALKNIVGALDDYLQDNPTMPSIDDPSAPTENFNHRLKEDEYVNFRKKINLYRTWIDEAWDETDPEESKVKWRKIFGEKFGTYALDAKKSTEAHQGVAGIRDTNEEIADRFSVRIDPRLNLKIGARVAKRKGFRHYELSSMGNVVYRSSKVRFRVTHNIPGQFDLYWKVRNTGPEAFAANSIRGQIVKDNGTHSREEPTAYRGHHFVEVYAVANGVCIAVDHQDVIIK
ncbi:SMODS domain-containing nucleotidyltransferase [Marisediminicola antarctica]|uniref:Adenylyl/Guanylyl and SMODS C-terminal sensor domain-containing protein n=1 Tax=Marisediminicola antarctica TaxID=674079 RepID=A0A7L5AKL5_9MICO|nr:nucleotidyltransferase [Marisediminicola antarctica]QHO70335.1 hypothetical protein BHD05_12440 [Marisediminicola antarctica]